MSRISRRLVAAVVVVLVSWLVFLPPFCARSFGADPQTQPSDGDDAAPPLVTATYDRFKDATHLSSDGIRHSNHVGGGSHLIRFFTGYKGKKPRPNTPLVLNVTAYNQEWTYLENKDSVQLIILLDSDKVVLPIHAYHSSVVGSVCMEMMFFDITPDIAAKLLKSKSWEAQIGTVEMRIDGQPELQAMVDKLGWPMPVK